MSLLLKVFIIFFSFAHSSYAALIYYNGGPSNNAIQASFRLMADDFSFDQSMDVLAALIHVNGLGDFGAWDGTLEYFIFEDLEGMPGEVLSTGFANNPLLRNGPLNWGHPYQQSRILEFNFNTEFTALSNNKYWIGIHLQKDYDDSTIFNQNGANWLYSSRNGNSWLSDYGTMDNWTQNLSGEMAFSLFGEPSPVPIPPSIWLLISAITAFYSFKHKLKL